MSEKSRTEIEENKCQFMQLSVKYLGYKIDTEGLHPVEEKVKAICEAPSPKNVTELVISTVLQGKRAKLWIFHYYGNNFLIFSFNPPHLVCRSCIMSSNCGQILIKSCGVITVLWLHQ